GGIAAADADAALGAQAQVAAGDDADAVGEVDVGQAAVAGQGPGIVSRDVATRDHHAITAADAGLGEGGVAPGGWAGAGAARCGGGAGGGATVAPGRGVGAVEHVAAVGGVVIGRDAAAAAEGEVEAAGGVGGAAAAHLVAARQEHAALGLDVDVAGGGGDAHTR